jgi:L-lactate dehydrogenase complex protein LldF
MSNEPGHNFRTASTQAVANKRVQTAVRKTADLLADMRAATVKSKTEFDELRRWGRARKLEISANLEFWAHQFATKVEERGGIVHWAKDAQQAGEIIADIARSRGVTTAVKSKSMTSEEIGLNAVLETAGIEVSETDLGEFIIQLFGEHPSHILAPAIHRNQDEVRQLFAEKLGAPPDLDVIGLVRFARKVLRDRFLNAGMGITGCNFAVADSGTVTIVTNEGNGRMCTTLPPLQVALVGMEKLIPSLQDLPDFLSLLTCSATGQRASSYINMTTGPRRADECEGPEEYHVVLLNNGRSDIATSPWREILHCLHCSACLNHCPVYKAVGGHAYESPYCGPMGSILSATLWGSEAYPDLANACTLCGRCNEVCAVQIPLRDYHRTLRNRNTSSTIKAMPSQLAAQSTARSAAYRLGMQALRKLLDNQPLSNLLPRINQSAANWTQNHELPEPQAQHDFRKWWRQRSQSQPQVMLKRSDQTQQRQPQQTPLNESEDLFAHYRQRAAAVGIEVVEITTTELDVKLKALLQEEETTDIALPQGNWPQELHQQIATLLNDSGCHVATTTADRSWDMTLLDKAKIGISYSPNYLAETGSLVFSAGPGHGTLASLLPEVQLSISPRLGLLKDLNAYMAAHPGQLPSRLIQVSGPSRTGDIEGTMTAGVHGPRRVIHWILSDSD